MATLCILLPSHWSALKGGAEFQADCLARYITGHSSHEVVYVARNVARAPGNEPYRIEVIPAGGRSRKFGFFLDAPALYRTLARLSPDVVLQHVGCAYTGIAAWYCKKQGTPLIWYVASDIDVRRVRRPISLRSLPARVDDLFLRYGIRHAGTIIAQTHVQAGELKKNYGREAKHVIPNFHPAVRQSAKKHQELTLLWIGNFKPLKRPELFLRLARESEANGSWRFRLIGRRDPSPWCNHVLSQVEKAPNTEYLGELSIEEVNRCLAEAHLLVNTSDYEGFPNTFIQAWLNEVPVVSLHVDPDGVMGRHGLGFQAGNLERMRAWIEATAANREELAHRGAHARRFAEQHYSMKNAQRLLDAIEAALIPSSGLSLGHISRGEGQEKA